MIEFFKCNSNAARMKFKCKWELHYIRRTLRLRGDSKILASLRYCWEFSVTLSFLFCTFVSQINISFNFSISITSSILLVLTSFVSLILLWSRDNIGIRAKGEVICELQEVSKKIRISNYRFQNRFYFKLFSVFCWVLGCGSKTFRLAVNPRYLIP